MPGAAVKGVGRHRLHFRLQALVLGLLAVAGSEVWGQEARRVETTGPEAVAERFFHGLGRLQWTGIVDLLHPDALADVDLVANQLVGSLRGDSILIQLYGATREEFLGWSDRETFLRTMTGMVAYARGLMESQVTTDVDILGTVMEGDTLAHVVYRERTDHMGTEIEEVSATTLRRAGGRWLIWRNPELEVLETAFRGLPIGRVPPPPPGGS